MRSESDEQVPVPAGRPAARRSVRPIVLGAILMAASALPARAHVPHDIVNELAVSPTFAQDQTLFAAVKLSDHTLFSRSTDGGRSWHQYGHPFLGAAVTQFGFSPRFATDGVAFVATEGLGVWRTADHGDTWEAVNLGLTDTVVHGLAVSPAFPTDGVVLAATAAGIARSTDGGWTWDPANQGLTEPAITAVAFAPGAGPASTAFACGQVTHRSDDGGLTWTPVASWSWTVKTLAISPAWPASETLAVGFGGLGGGIRFSTDGGGSWVSAELGLADPYVNELGLAPDGTAFAATHTHVYRAPALGASWSEIETGLDDLALQTGRHYGEIQVGPDFLLDGLVFLGGFEGVFRSDDAGDAWTPQDLHHQRLHLQLAFSPDYARDRFVYLHDYGGGVFRYRDGAPRVSGARKPGPVSGPSGPSGPPAGAGLTGPVPGGADVTTAGSRSASSWTAFTTQMTSLWAASLGVSPGFARDRTVYAGFSEFYRSENDGLDWTIVATPLAPGKVVRGVGLSPDYPVDGTLLIGSDGKGAWRSTDKGQQWSLLTGGLPATIDTEVLAFSPDFGADRTVLIATQDASVWRSTDGGDTWTSSSAGLPGPWARAFALSPAFAADGTAFVGLRGEGVFKSTDGGVSWNPSSAGLPVATRNVIESLAISPGFAQDRTLFAVTLDDGVFRSRDAGASWQPAAAGLPDDAPFALAISPDFVNDGTLVLSTFDWAWISRDAGESWSKLPGFIRVNGGHPTVFATPDDWTAQHSPDNTGADYRIGTVAGSWQEFTFFGDSIAWYANRTDDSGIAAVSLDGGPPVRVDLHTPGVAIQVPVFDRSFGSADWHTIRVEVTGAKNAVSGGIDVQSDGFLHTF